VCACTRGTSQNVIVRLPWERVIASRHGKFQNRIEELDMILFFFCAWRPWIVARLVGQTPRQRRLGPRICCKYRYSLEASLERRRDRGPPFSRLSLNDVNRTIQQINESQAIKKKKGKGTKDNKCSPTHFLGPTHSRKPPSLTLTSTRQSALSRGR
jgi:hypothetical protein